MTFKIDTHNCLTIEANSQFNNLLKDKTIQLIPQTNSSNTPYIILKPDNQIGETKFLKVIFSDENIFTLEIRTEVGNTWKQYRYITNDKNEAYEIINNYFIYYTAPDLQRWKNITYELLNNSQNNEIDKTSLKNAKKLLIMSDSEIEFDMINFLNEYSKKTQDVIISTWETNNISKLYFSNKGIRNGDINWLDIEEKSRLEFLYNNARSKFENDQNMMIMSYIDECIAWKKNKRKFTKGEINLFFFEKKLKIPYDMIDIFYLTVNDKLMA